MSMEFSTQLFLGDGEKALFSPDRIGEKIARAKDSLDLKKLMVWDTHPSETTGRILRWCRDLGIETYLWHPVLADMNGIDVTRDTMAPVPFHDTLEKLSGIWEKTGTGEENFLFIDPVESEFNEKNFSGFRSLMDEFDFDGVFLDRIRYTSPANGFETVFSTYLTAGIAGSVGEREEKLEAFYSGLRKMTDAELENRESFEEIFSPFADFFLYKKEQICLKVAFYRTEAEKRGKKFGLDLLATGLSFFTGQDYVLLSGQCDWIKDMTYCYAMGPAALPLEILCLARGFSLLAPRVSEQAFLRFFERHSGLTLPGTLAEIASSGIDPENASREMMRAAELTDNRVPLYSGIELVNSPYFSTRVREEMAGRYADALKGKTDGVVASWNILHIPDSNLELLGRRMNI